MIFLDVTSESAPAGDQVVESNLTSMIGLAGDLKGVLAIHCPAETAQGITGAMLGMEVEELNEDVKDAIGEIANMVAGGLKTSLAAEGRDTELAIPTTAIGTSIRTSGLAGARRLVQVFTTPVGRFAIELKYVLD